jgi:hypothetical protein
MKRFLLRALGAADLGRFCKFLMFDFDDALHESLRGIFRQEFTANHRFIDSNLELFSIGGFNPFQYAGDMLQRTTAEARDIQGWLDPQCRRFFPNRLADNGTGCHRQTGRLGFTLNYRTFEQQIIAAVRHNNDGFPAPGLYWIVTSSCGGTGSSFFLDVLYLISKIHHGHGLPAPIVRPIIYSPDPFIKITQHLHEDAGKRLAANAYAFFLELQKTIDRHQSGGARAGIEAASEFALPSVVNNAYKAVNWRPFPSALIMDTACEDGSLVPFSQLYPVTAEMIAYNILAGADPVLNNWWANPVPQRDPTTGSWRYWMASGFRSVEYPSQPIREYSAAAYFSDLMNSYLAPTSMANVAIQEERAKDILERLVIEPFGPSGVARSSHAPACAQSFRSLAERNHLSPRARRWGSTDEFCRTGEHTPNFNLAIDLAAITKETLSCSVEQLDGDINLMKDEIRKDFADRFGHPSGPRQADYYHLFKTRLWEQFEGYIEKEGICTIIGSAADFDAGMIQSLTSNVVRRLGTLQSTINDSARRFSQLRGERIDHLSTSVVEEAERKRGPMGLLRSGNALRAMLESFAQLRIELVQEAFNNQLLLLEIELLRNVGSLLEKARNQSVRIMHWMRRAADEANILLRDEVANLAFLNHDAVRHFMPGIDTIELNGVRGHLADRSINRLRMLGRVGEHRLRAFTSLTCDRAISWSAICPEEGDDSGEALALFREGATEWVRQQIRTDPELTSIAGNEIASYVGADQQRQRQIRSTLSASNVLVFSRVDARVRTQAPATRLVVTGTPAQDPFTQTVGVGPNDSHLRDQTAPWRAAVVKYFSPLCLEEVLPMLSTLEPLYTHDAGFEPHIRKDGRSYYRP